MAPGAAAGYTAAGTGGARRWPKFTKTGRGRSQVVTLTWTSYDGAELAAWLADGRLTVSASYPDRRVRLRLDGEDPAEVAVVHELGTRHPGTVRQRLPG